MKKESLGFSWSGWIKPVSVPEDITYYSLIKNKEDGLFYWEKVDSPFKED